MRYLVALYVLLAAAVNLFGADRVLEAKAALLLASAAPKANATCPSCTSPSDCTCDQTKCECQNCAVTKKAVQYTWKESADPCCSLLYADGKAIGWYNSVRGIYYAEVQPGYGRAAVCPVATPMQRMMPQYPTYYQPQYRSSPVFFSGGVGGCSSGG